jgi:hypothetical protein
MAVARIQSQISSGSGTTDNLTLTGVVNGRVVCGLLLFKTANPTFPITQLDDADGAYTQVNAFSDGTRLVVAFYKVITGTTGNKTITATWSPSAQYAMYVAEVSGADSVTPFPASGAIGAYQANLGTGTDNLSAGSRTPGRDGTLFLASFFNFEGASASGGTDFTVNDTNAGQQYGETFAQTTAAAHAGTMSVTSANGNWISGLLIIQPPSGVPVNDAKIVIRKA